MENKSNVLDVVDELVNNFTSMLNNDYSSYENYFGDKNKELFESNFDEYKGSIKDTVYLLEESLKLLKENISIIIKAGLEKEIVKQFNNAFKKIGWMNFAGDRGALDFRKPTKDEVNIQIKSYISVINLQAFFLIDYIRKAIDLAQSSKAIQTIYFENVITELNDKVARADEIIVNLTQKNEFAKSRETIDIYEKAKFSYGWRTFLSRIAFLFFLVSIPASFLFFDLSKYEFSTEVYNSYNEKDMVKILIFRLPITLVLGTIAIYFLKLSSFYLSKGEEAKKTYYELSAFPFYVSELSKEDINELRKSFAYHYFGKDVNYELFDKMSNASNSYADMANKSMSTIVEMLKQQNSSEKVNK